MESFKQKLDQYLGCVVPRIIEEPLASHYRILSQFLIEGGKRLRPICAYSAFNGYGGSGDILPAAASVELMHCSSLVHDDIMDEDEFRRGHPTIFKQHSDRQKQGKGSNIFVDKKGKLGASYAIIAGNILYSIGQHCLMESEFEPQKVLFAVRSYERTFRIVNDGQILDMEMSTRRSATIDEYINMVQMKSAALFELSLSLGAHFAGAKEEHIGALISFGRHMAIGFQIHDDILDLTDGKGHALGSDIKEGKMTIIVIHALTNAKPTEKKEILSHLGNGAASSHEIDRVIDMFTKTKSILHAQEEAKRQISLSKKALVKAGLRKNEFDFFFGLADKMITRKK